MRRTAGHGLVFLAALFCPAFVRAAESLSFPQFCDLLRKADEWEILSLHPLKPQKESDYADYKIPRTRRFFRGYPVYGSIKVSDKAKRSLMVDALQLGVILYQRERDRYPGQHLEHGCFDPRHAIRTNVDGHTIEAVICFQCSQIVVYGAHTSVFLTKNRAESLLDELLRSGGIELAPKRRGLNYGTVIARPNADLVFPLDNDWTAEENTIHLRLRGSRAQSIGVELAGFSQQDLDQLKKDPIRAIKKLRLIPRENRTDAEFDKALGVPETDPEVYRANGLIQTRIFKAPVPPALRKVVQSKPGDDVDFDPPDEPNIDWQLTVIEGGTQPFVLVTTGELLLVMERLLNPIRRMNSPTAPTKHP